MTQLTLKHEMTVEVVKRGAHLVVADINESDLVLKCCWDSFVADEQAAVLHLV
jgi:hypothetical protein